MATDGASSFSARRERARYRLVFWIGWLVVIMVLFGAKGWAYRKNVAVLKDFQACRLVEQQKVAALCAAMDARRLPLAHQSQEVVLRQLADCGPFTTIFENTRQRYRKIEYHDYPNGMTYGLEFSEDQLMSYSWRYTWRSPSPPVWSGFVPACQWIAGAAGVAWVIGLALALSAWRYHRRIGEVMMALALLCVGIGMLDDAPDGFLAMNGNSLWFSGVILVLTVLMMLAPNRRQRTRMRCENCEYDLTGNQSGVCSECGRAIPGAMNEEHARRLDGVREG